jgi:hypothetical protein
MSHLGEIDYKEHCQKKLRHPPIASLRRVAQSSHLTQYLNCVERLHSLRTDSMNYS